MGVAQLVRFAKALGLDAISITDHDTMAGQEEAIEEGEKQGLRIIPGVEISAYNPGTGRKAHILGYNVRDMESLSRECRPWLLARHEKNLESLDKVTAAGYPVSRDDVPEYAALDGTLYRQHIMHALVDRCYTPTIFGSLYTRLFGPNGIALVKARYIKAAEAVRLIRDCGGLAILAHPFQYDSMDYLPYLAALGLAGIEYKHPTQTPERQEAVIEAARRHGLFLTGGSDFHGFYSDPGRIPGSTINFLSNDDTPLLCGGVRHSGKTLPPGSVYAEIQEDHPLWYNRSL
jgi:predicted metal-dependent phosphoesterase TrpH